MCQDSQVTSGCVPSNACLGSGLRFGPGDSCVFPITFECYFVWMYLLNLCQIEQCTDKYREECDLEGEEATTQGETREGVVDQWRRKRVGGGWRLTYHPAARQFLAPSFGSAHKQTPHEPKGDAGLRCTKTRMSSQSDSRQASPSQQAPRV